MSYYSALGVVQLDQLLRKESQTATILSRSLPEGCIEGVNLKTPWYVAAWPGSRPKMALITAKLYPYDTVPLADTAQVLEWHSIQIFVQCSKGISRPASMSPMSADA